MTLKSMLALACAASTLAACQGGTIYKKDKFGDLDVLSVDARQRLVLQGEVDGQRIVCTEPSPDAIVAQAAEIAASANGPLAGGNAAGRLAAGYSESAGSIALRTQTIQLLRDGYFRLCEARLNNQIDKNDYKATMLFIDEFIATVAAIEALGGMVQAPSLAINANGNASAADANATVGGAATNPVTNNLNVNTAGLSEKTAEHVRAILSNYYRRKAAFQAWLDGGPASSGQIP